MIGEIINSDDGIVIGECVNKEDIADSESVSGEVGDGV